MVALRIELSTTRLSAVPGQPALDYRFRQVGMVGLEPTIPSPRNRWVCRYPTSQNRLPVRTAGFEPAIPWPPTRCDNHASPRSEKGRFERKLDPNQTMARASTPFGLRDVCTRACSLFVLSKIAARTVSAEWARRRSNPRPRCFKPPLYRLSYQPSMCIGHEKRPDVARDTGPFGRAPESDLCHKRKVRTGAVFAGSWAKHPVHVSCSLVLHFRDNIVLVPRSCGPRGRVTSLTVV